MIVICSNIQWETDGQDVDLPTRVVFTDADFVLFGYAGEKLLSSDAEDEEYFLGEMLSNEYGFLHNGFEYEKIEPQIIEVETRNYDSTWVDDDGVEHDVTLHCNLGDDGLIIDVLLGDEVVATNGIDIAELTQMCK